MGAQVLRAPPDASCITSDPQVRVVYNQTMKMAGRWVLEIDVRKFFDSLDHSHLRNIVCERIRDGVQRSPLPQPRIRSAPVT